MDWVHCPGGNATDPIWRVLASSDGISCWTPLKPQHSNSNPNRLANQLWCSDFLTPPTPLIIPHRLPTFLESLMPLKNWCSIHARCSKILLHIVLLSLFIAFLKFNIYDSQALVGCIWKSDLTDKMKRSFFQTAVASILLYGCTTWTLTKQLEKKLDGNYTRMLRAILNKSWRQHPTRHQLYGHLPPITKAIQVRRTRHAGHCWRSRDELISDVLLWTPTHGRAKAGRPARTYIQQLCEYTGCCPEDLPEAMNEREKWRERVRDIRATSMTWWWWWWWWWWWFQLSECIFEIHQLRQSGFSRVYSNCCCSCSAEPDNIKIGQLSRKMYSNNTLNFQESTTNLNACTKKSVSFVLCLINVDYVTTWNLSSHTSFHSIIYI